MPIRLVQITDTHIHDQPGIDFKGTQPDLYLRRIVQHIKHTLGAIDALILTGDIVHDSGEAACRLVAECLRPLDCPVYVTLGNHDDSRIIKEHLLDDKFIMPGVIELERWQLLFTDSHIEQQTHGCIGDDDLLRLQERLEQNHKPALLFTHHPPMKTGSRWMDEIGIHNGEAFIEHMLSHENLKGVLFGHIHQHWDSRARHLRLLGTPSTCVQFKPYSEDFGIDERDPGYRIIRLDEEAFETEVVRCPMQVKKIISGGQTGVDRAALDTAMALAIPHGGWCPRGRLALDGPIDSIYQLQETPSAAYTQRTEWNVRDSDGTLIVSWGKPEGGTALTARLADKLRKPRLIIDLQDPAPIQDVVDWLYGQHLETLNIAGPRHSKHEQIYPLARQYLSRILSTAT